MCHNENPRKRCDKCKKKVKEKSSKNVMICGQTKAADNIYWHATDIMRYLAIIHCSACEYGACL